MNLLAVLLLLAAQGESSAEPGWVCTICTTSDGTLSIACGHAAESERPTLETPWFWILLAGGTLPLAAGAGLYFTLRRRGRIRAVRLDQHGEAAD